MEMLKLAKKKFKSFMKKTINDLLNWVKGKDWYFIFTNLFFVISVSYFSLVSLQHVRRLWEVTNSNTMSYLLAIGTGLSIIVSMMGSKYTKVTYISFFSIILIELFGNIFSAFLHIDVNSYQFKSWVELTSPVFDSWFYFEEGSQRIAFYKRIISILNGVPIPLLAALCFHIWMKVRSEYKSIVSTSDEIIEKEYPEFDKSFTIPKNFENPAKFRSPKKKPQQKENAEEEEIVNNVEQEEENEKNLESVKENPKPNEQEKNESVKNEEKDPKKTNTIKNRIKEVFGSRSNVRLKRNKK